MECRKWEETGLLYSVQELGSKETCDYEEHLKECDDCRSELYRYRQEHKSFFTVENLGVAPSAKVDAEIVRLCSDPRKNVVAPALFPAFFRKAFVPVALFVIGFFSVGYIMLNVQNASVASNAKSLSTPTADDAAVAAMPGAPSDRNVSGVAANDSLGDSLNNNPGTMNYAKTRGTLNGQGAIPVDLQNK